MFCPHRLPVRRCKLPQRKLPKIEFCQEALSPHGIRKPEYLLIDFGESGNNFIEIGKEPKGLKSMLELCCS